MKRYVTAITGLSGVGKSTLVQNLAAAIPFQYLLASKLILEARQSNDWSLASDELRAMDLDENQSLLIRGFHRALNQDGCLVVLDAHTVIEQDDRLVLIPSTVFRRIGIDSMIFLTAESADIVGRRVNDKTRQRPIKSVGQVNDIQDRALQHAKEICSDLRIPINSFDSADCIGVTALLRSYVSALTR